MMADHIVSAGKAYPTPNWKKWRLIPEPRLWQCVALSLDIDPDSIEIDPVFGRDPIFPRRFRELRDRTDIAREGLRGPLHSRQIDIYNPLRSRVSLHQFAVWAHRIGWGLPPELLAVADQHCQDIDWNYWTALDLWPLVVACKLVYGVNPNEPTRLEDIENPETKTRPAWVNLFHKAQAAIMAEKLKVQAGCVFPAEFVAWVQGKGIEIPGELLAMADKGAAHNEEIARKHKRNTAPPANIFRTMTGLKWSEVSITFIEPEAVRIKARGAIRTVTYEAMGFKDQQSRMAKPNKVWGTLRTLAIVASTSKTLTDTLPLRTDFKRRVSRLRGSLQAYFGIEDNPIRYTGGEYKPAFSLIAEEHVNRGVRDQLVPDAEDEEDIAEFMSRPPGR